MNLRTSAKRTVELFSQVKSFCNRATSRFGNFLKTHEISKRLIVLSLMIVLMMPAFFLGDWIKSVAAFEKSLVSSTSPAPVPNSAPPAPFIVSSSGGLSARLAANFLSINTSLTNGVVSVARFFTAPEMPEGFGIVQPISPAYGLALSIGDSVESFFGFSFSNPTSNAMFPPPVVPAGSVSFDFDGDDKADASRYRGSNGQWEIKNSSNGTTSSYILSGQIVPADYDGDSITDIASFVNGNWMIRRSSDGQTQALSWGTSGDIPVTGDYDGDGKAELAIYRPSTNTWWILQSSNSAYTTTGFGAAGDIPVQGNYDGDNKTDIAVYRPSTGVWHILGSSSGYYTIQWGAASDIPVPADYDGDGKTDCAVFRGAAGTWYIYKSSAPGQYIAQGWGNYGDQPVPADYDGDGKADLSVWRPTTGMWHTTRSSDSGYQYQTLGAVGDTAVPSAYLKKIGGEMFSYEMARTRLSPKNATGGTNLYSRNFGWSAGLVGLAGRAGLDMGFGISYNSSVWTKQTDSSNNSTMYFDVDSSNISPGFRFGYPTIEPVYYDGQTGNFSYLMVTPSGGRVEFRQKTGASDTYETSDSSYVQLKTNGASSANDAVENFSITVSGTDGTKMTYLWKGGAFRASEIKDRNGNFITINHDEYGLLRTVTDTLGRVVTVNYDTYLFPTSITQTWKDANGSGQDITHYWARFQYNIITINPSFSGGLGVFGPTGGTPVNVLEKIIAADDSATVFEYQPNSFGQVSKIRNLAPDGHELNFVQTNLATPGTNLTDCPKLSQTSVWTENFNNNQPTVINNDLTTGQSYSLPDGHSGTASKIEVTMANHPHGAITKTFVGETGWMESLPIASEDWANGTGGSERKRWTWTGWTQDDVNLSYIQNPRAIESKVGDTTNIKRSTTEYRLIPNTTVSEYGLVNKVEVYDTDQLTVLKRAETDYNLDSNYISRRIIGLPSEMRTYGVGNGSLVLATKATYAYDEENFAQETNQNILTVIQHDNTNYSANFITGRANLTSTTRHDITGQTASVSSKMRYDIAGNAVSKLDPLNRKLRIEYTDSFNDTTATRNTFAYPTKLFDPANNYSEVKYRFDTGANVRAKSPAPAGNTSGKETAREYDAIGRILKETLTNTGAYTRYEYPTNAIQAKVYSTIVDTNNNGADSADEVSSESWTDGAGRVLRSRTEHPGSTGGFSATVNSYDILGQTASSTVPTEVDANWQLAGDGQTRGWLWKSQEYDWKGRAAKSINTDGTFSQAFYDGCGCAGGEIVTIEGEQLADGKRKQRVYSDILGRKYKTEILNWDNSVYSTTIVKYDERDQTDWVKQYVGAAPQDALSSDSCPIQPAGEPQSCQITKMTYDGHGRLKTQHRPEQDADKATVYDYYQSDEVQKVTDARGATATYSYNERGLVTNINYAMPPASQTVNNANSVSWCGYDDCCFDPEECGGGGNSTSSPLGWLDSVDPSNWKVKGWSYDPDNSSASNTVHIYIDGPAGTGTFAGQVNADKPRSDVNNAYGISGDHGFEFTIPNQYLDGKQHKIYAYGIDTGTDPSNLLSGSPKSFSFSQESSLPPLETSVAFEYDNIGNRLWMTDTLGRTDYEYDSLSRLKAETRSFTDTTQNGSPLVMANAPLPNNGFKLQYTYGLANQLTSLTDPFGAAINYGYDEAGRLDNVTGSSFGGVTTYASNAGYEAWGGLEKLIYGSGLQMQMTFNNRLQASTYSLAGGTSGQLMNKQYDYYSDGSLRYAQDLLDPKFDRLNIYDHVGRIKEGKSGAEARDGTVPQNEQDTSLPYRQSYQFNAFGNLTQRNNLHWGVESWYGQSNNLSYTYKNNRVQGAGWQYDMDGRNLQTAYPDDYASSIYNAAGQMIRSKTAQTDALRRYDGNGREIKRQTANFYETQNSLNWLLQPTKYYIRSSVLGNEVVSEVWANGRKGKTFVRAAGAQLATQSAYGSDTASLNEAVIFEYTDASGMSQRTTNKLGAAVASGDGGEGSPVETDPMGGSVGTSTPYIQQFNSGWEPSPEYPMLLPYFDDAPQYVNGQRVSCNLDGMAVGCSQAFRMMGNGSAAQCPNNDCGPRTGTYRDIYGKDHHFVAPLTLTDKGFGLQVPSGIQRIREVDAMILAIRGGDWRTYANAFQSPNINIGTFSVTVKAEDDDVEPIDFGKDGFIDALIKTFKATDLINRRVEIFKFNKSQKSMIIKSLYNLILNKKCVDTFKDAQIPTPADIIKDKGLLFIHIDALKYPDKNLEKFGISELYRQAFRGHQNVKSSGFTPDLNIYQGLKQATTILYDWSFTGYNHPFSETMPHESIHRAGITPQYSNWQYIFPFYGHDLTAYKYYDEIIKNCEIPGGVE